ncbi:hypothetical protein TNCV_2699801 [Trichonephila clavipes]|nr:hypothetical protein TNCV_2699801 [Trichonephila clavipes]
MLIEEWALLPQEMLHQLVLSMRRRCEATIAASIKIIETEKLTLQVPTFTVAVTQVMPKSHDHSGNEKS